MTKLALPALLAFGAPWMSSACHHATDESAQTAAGDLSAGENANGESPEKCGSPTHMPRVAHARLDVTHGKIGELASGAFRIRDPEVRAVIPGTRPDAAEMRFFYRGPSDKNAPLASGELRRQIGLKLRAQNGCNLVYVMWRIEPVAELVVSVKSNPGQSTHAQCGARGYRYPKADTSIAAPLLAENEPHVLRAELKGDALTVHIDEQKVWSGSLGQDVAQMQGPVGLRTDNGKFDVDYFAANASAPSPSDPEDE